MNESVSLAESLLELSSIELQSTGQPSKKPKPNPKVLIYWIEDRKTSIVNISSIPHSELKEGNVTDVKWKEPGKPQRTFKGKIIKIGFASELAKKEEEVNIELCKFLNADKENGENNSAPKPTKRDRKFPSVLTDYVIDNEASASDDERKKENKKKREVSRVQVNENRKQHDELFTLEPIWGSTLGNICNAPKAITFPVTVAPIVTLPESQDILDMDLCCSSRPLDLVQHSEFNVDKPNELSLQIAVQHSEFNVDVREELNQQIAVTGREDEIVELKNIILTLKSKIENLENKSCETCNFISQGESV